jgi:RND family efflux transporter MFP subunit
MLASFAHRLSAASAFPTFPSSVLRLGMAVLPALLLAACGEAKSDATIAKVEPRVLVARVHYAPDTEARAFVATIRPRIETDQGFRVAGKVARRLVEVGERVAPDQVLATLDDTDLKLQLEQAQAEANAARISLEQTMADEARSAALHSSGWTSQAAYDRQHAATEEARGRDRRAQRAVELAANAVTYSALKADSAGVVTATFVEPGQVIAIGQAAIRLARLGEKEALIAVPESLLSQARQSEASLALWSVPGKPYLARLRELSPTTDPATRTYAARFSIPDADDAVALGMSATLTLSDQHSIAVAKVPLSALFNQGDGPALWCVEADGTLALQHVAVARYDGEAAYVTGGVPEGAAIVTLGVQKLEPHEKVRIVNALGS